MKRSLLTLAVWCLSVRLAGGQETAAWTPQRQKMVGELLVDCVAEQGLTLTALPGGKGKLFRVADRTKLRASLAARRKRLGPEMRQALVAFWSQVNDQSRAAVVELLDLAGQETKDDQARGLAAYLTALDAQQYVRLEEAATAYLRALPYFQKGNQPGWTALCFNDLGYVTQARGAYAEAVRHYKEALRIYRRLYPPARYPNGHAHLAAGLTNLGLALDARGAYAEAESYLKQALVMFRQLYPPSRYPHGDPTLATALHNLGGVLKDQGAVAEAIRYFKQALVMRRDLFPPSRYPDGHPAIAVSLDSMALALQEQGFHHEVLDYSKQGLEMRRRLYPPTRYPRGHPELARSLNNLGFEYVAQGARKEALDCFKQALAMLRQLYPPARYPHGHPDLTLTLNNLGAVFQEQGENRKALDSYTKALRTLRTYEGADRDLGPEAARLLRPEPLLATTLRRRALVLTRMLGVRPSAAQLRRVERAWSLSAALHDRLRGEILYRDSDKLRHGEDAAVQLTHHLDVLARLFQRAGKPQDLQTAFTVIEQGRARLFLESLGQAHAATLAGLPAGLAAEERRLSLTLRESDARIQRLSLQAGDEVARQVRQLAAERLKLEEQEQAFLTKLHQSHPRYAGFRHPQPCSVAQARSCLGKNEVALLFAVGKDFSYALLLEKTPRPGDKNEGIHLVRLPGGQDLNPLLGTLLSPETLQHPARARELAGELYRKLIGPLQDRLQGRDLLLVPDGALALLPFELLVEGQTDDDDGHWLLEKHRIRYAPSLTSLYLSHQVKRQKPTRLLWALGDPLFGAKFKRLANSSREVDAICKALGVPLTQTVRGAQASEAAVKAARGEIAKARFVHFATHGLVSERSAYETALVLNQVGNDGKEELGGVNDGLLRLPEITFLDFNADVVVLSACETARGRRSRGEGVSGLARTFLYRGSKAVVCSLWSVDDTRTADLMAGFYGHLKAGQEAPEALRQAQLALMRKGLAPFFWAPFILMGQ